MLDNLTQTLTHASKLSDEKLLSLRDELKTYRDDSQKLYDQVNDEFKARMHSQGITEMKVANRSIKLVFVPMFNRVSIAIARQLGATIVSPDTKKLKAVYESGTEVEGMTSYERVDVR